MNLLTFFVILITRYHFENFVASKTVWDTATGHTIWIFLLFFSTSASSGKPISVGHCFSDRRKNSGPLNNCPWTLVAVMPLIKSSATFIAVGQ